MWSCEGVEVRARGEKSDRQEVMCSQKQPKNESFVTLGKT